MYAQKILKDLANAMILHQGIEAATLHISIQELNADGSSLATFINSMSLALLDAATPLKCFVSCVACIVLNKQILLDPTQKEIEASDSCHTFAFNNLDELFLCESFGSFSQGEYVACLDLCKAACKSIRDFMRVAVEKKLNALAELEG